MGASHWDCPNGTEERTSRTASRSFALHREIFEAGFRRANQRDHFALGRAVFMHRLVAFGDLLELVSPGEAGIALPVEHPLIEPHAFFFFCDVASPLALFPHPPYMQSP